ncbi:MAG: hypothetical protein M3416_07545 [Acidobacteriota bacterium]|nr:hypothetical protein [Acidobacteriota bacterium]
MKRFLPILLLMLALAPEAAAQLSSSTARRINPQASAPATCSADRGEVYFNTTDDKLYRCTAANTWTETGAVTSPGGSDTQLQRNNAGAFGGISGATSDGTNLNAADANFFVAGSADATKKLRFEVDGFTAGNTRVATFPDASITVARADAAQTFTGSQTFGSALLAPAGAVLGYSFAGNTTTGLRYTSGRLITDIGGSSFFAVDGLTGNAQVAGSFQFSLTANASPEGSPVVGVGRHENGVLKVTDGSTGQGALLAKRRVSAKTAGYTVTAAETDTVFTNAGAGAGITFTLPAPSAGLQYTFVVAAAQSLTVVPGTPAAEAINNAGTVDADDSVASSTAGHTVTLTAIDSATWVVTSITGTWP